MEIFGVSFGRKDKNKNNPSSSEFDKTINTELEEIIDNYSATSLKDREEDNSGGISPDIYSDSFKDITCIPVNSNKTSRLRQYSVMSRFAEIDWCISEIGLDFLHLDENKKFINIFIKDVKHLDENKIKVLNNEFDHFIKLFDFDQNGYTIIKNYIIEGEACWENVIDPTSPEKGIRALKYIPTKYYDFIKDKKTGQMLGVYFDKDLVNYDIITGILSNSYAGASNIFNAIVSMPGYTYAMSMTENKIPLYWPQITYFNSGMYNYENTVVYPLIENAAAPYQQLSLLQDACVILRITRAPERLVFNIATGGLPEKKARSMVSTFINNFKSKKVSNSRGEVRNSYDPAAMLDAYFFWKQDGSEGSSVNAINSQAQYDQMADIDYFLRRILKAFKVPYTRFKEEGVAVQRKETITYEEYAFTRYIIKQQISFANAIKKTFITHLKLRKIWEQYNLNDTLLDIEFVKPSLYEMYQAQQLFALKMDIYKNAVEDDALSKNMAMQKYLGYSDDMVKRNAEEKRKEMLYIAETEYYAELMKKNGPKGSIPPIKIKSDEEVSGGTSTEEIPTGEEISPTEEEIPPESSEETPSEESNKSNPPLDDSSETLTIPPEEGDISSAETSNIISQEGESIPEEPETEYIPPEPEITNLEMPKEIAAPEVVELPIVKKISSELPTFREIFSKQYKGLI